MCHYWVAVNLPKTRMYGGKGVYLFWGWDEGGGFLSSEGDVPSYDIVVRLTPCEQNDRREWKHYFRNITSYAGCKHLLLVSIPTCPFTDEVLVGLCRKDSPRTITKDTNSLDVRCKLWSTCTIYVTKNVFVKLGIWDQDIASYSS